MTTKAEERRELVRGAAQRIGEILDAGGVSRSSLDDVKSVLVGLTGRLDLFDETDFPGPGAGGRSKVHQLSEGETNALYIVCAPPGLKTPPHDHTTWAVIVGLEGEEKNTVYKRLDDGSVDGEAHIEHDDELTLRHGDGIALMPEDVHHIEAVSDVPTRHFHLYGVSFQRQVDRVMFDLDTGTTRSFSGADMVVDRTHLVDRQPT